jgi:hypothetical protein
LRVGETLALSGCNVRVLATTAMERAGSRAPYDLLAAAGFAPRIHPAKTAGRLRPEIRYHHGSLPCRVVDVGRRRLSQWEPIHGHAFDSAFDDELRQFQPDIVLTYPGSPADFKRHARARRRSAAVVLALPDLRYLGFGPELSHYDASLCHSAWLAGQYRESTVLRPVTLPPPIPAAEVTPDSHDAACVTFIPPSYENGVLLLLRLAEQLSIDCPDLPILVLSQAGAETTGESLIEVGLSGGIDLRGYENIALSEPAASPKDVWEPTRLLVAPALGSPPTTWIAEALVNGIPPVVSDRCGLAEVLNGAGFALPMPLDYTPESRAPLPLAAVEEWVDLVLRLVTEEAFYAGESEKARRAAHVFQPETLAPRYARFFTAAEAGRPFDE